ncbi:MAG: hypothetical protein L3K02_05130, partial [Thermoplasmata archaeon]|nr:hypothetical protein [Thermoplasmata archaeon]
MTDSKSFPVDRLASGGKTWQIGDWKTPRFFLPRKAVGFALGVVILVVVGTLASSGSIAPASVHPGTAERSSLLTSVIAARANSLTPTSTSTAHGACRNGGGGSASPTSAAGSREVGPTVSPAPQLYNSQIAPYAVLTGHYGYVAAGAALRDQGYGKINLTWPGAPSTTNLVSAYMIWSFLDSSLPPSYGTLNGVNVTGTWAAYTTPSPCWDPTYVYTFVADVTSLVTNGINDLTNFPTALTNGSNPWNYTYAMPMIEGVSLVAV